MDMFKLRDQASEASEATNLEDYLIYSRPVSLQISDIWSDKNLAAQ